MPKGVKYIELATTTANDIWESWDSNTCNGGIFWTRDRNAATPSLRDYKSTITNAQFLSYSARLYLITGNKTLLDRGIATWKWLREIDLVTSEGEAHDGANAPTCTGFYTGYTESYIYGQLVEGLGYMYEATKNSEYLDSAELLTQKMLSTYSRDNVIRDVNCEPNCPLNRVSPKGILFRGLAIFYPFATDSTKALIRTHIEASFNGMLKTCNAQFACSNYWGLEGTVYSDFHHQLNVVGLFYAAQAIYAPPVTKVKFKYTSDLKVVLAEAADYNASNPDPNTSEGNIAYSFTSFAGIVLFLYSLFWITY